MNAAITITLIIVATVTIITSRICVAVERVASAPKVVRIAFDKGGAE